MVCGAAHTCCTQRSLAHSGRIDRPQVLLTGFESLPPLNLPTPNAAKERALGRTSTRAVVLSSLLIHAWAWATRSLIQLCYAQGLTKKHQKLRMRALTRRASAGAGSVPRGAAEGQGLLPAANGPAQALLPGRRVCVCVCVTCNVLDFARGAAAAVAAAHQCFSFIGAPARLHFHSVPGFPIPHPHAPMQCRCGPFHPTHIHQTAHTHTHTTGCRCPSRRCGDRFWG